MSTMTGIAGALPRPSTAAPLTAPTDSAVAELATRRSLSIVVTTTAGAPVTIPASELRDALASADAMRAFEARHGIKFGTGSNEINRADFFRALSEATRTSRNSSVDLSRHSSMVTLYNGVDSDFSTSGSGLVRNEAVVQTGVEGAFALGGRSIDAPSRNFWDVLLDILVTVVSFGIAYKHTGFGGGVDDDRWRDAGATFAMAGGVALRDEVRGMTPEAAERRIEEIVRQANPDITYAQVRSIAHRIREGMDAVWNRAGMTNDGLDALQRAYQTSGNEAFGGNAGHWLRSHTGRHAGEATLERDLRTARSPAEAQAALALALPGYVQMDAESQVRLAQMAFELRGSEGSAAYARLLDDGAIARLSATERRGLLRAVRDAGNGLGDIQAARQIASAMDASQARPETRAAIARGLADISALPLLERGPALAAYARLISSSAFLALPESAQREVLSVCRRASHDPTRLADLTRMVAAPGFNELAMNDVPTVAKVAQAIATAPSAGVRQGLVSLVSVAGFRALPAARRGAIVDAMATAHTAAGRRTVLELVNSAGFGALSPARQDALLQRFIAIRTSATGAEPFAHLPALLDAAHRAGLPESSLAMIVTQIVSAPAAQADARVRAFTVLVPTLTASHASEVQQRQAITALVAGGYTTDVAARLGSELHLRGLAHGHSAAFVADTRALLAAEPLASASPSDRLLFISTVARTPAPSDAQVHALAARIAAPAFQALPEPERRAEMAGHVAVMATGTTPAHREVTERLLAHPNVRALDPEVRRQLLERLARHTGDTAALARSLEQSVGSAGFASLSATARERLVLRLAGAPNAEQLAQTYAGILSNARFASLPAGVREQIATQLHTNANPVEYGTQLQRVLDHAQFAALLASPRFAALPEANRTALLRACLALEGDPSLALTAMNRLINSANFQALPQAQRLSVLAQAINYPNQLAIDTLERLCGAAWFRSSSLADQQRAAKLMGHFATMANGSADPTHRSLLLNTIGQFVPQYVGGVLQQAPVTLDFQTYPAIPGSTTFGSALNRQMHLNITLVPAGDGPMNAMGDKMADTVVHEVNHLVNGDAVRSSYRYLMGEYGAWYAGNYARYGRPPTRQEAWDRFTYFFDSTSGAYESFRSMLQDAPSEEFAKVVEFFNNVGFFTPALTNSRSSAELLLNSHGTRPTTPAGTASAPGPWPVQTPPRDMDNHSVPPLTSDASMAEPHAH